MRPRVDPSDGEKWLLVNASERDLLPGVLHDWRADLDMQDKLPYLPELAEVLLRLLDEGRIEVRRFTPELDAVGSYEVLSRSEVVDAAADPATWLHTERGWLHRDDGLGIVMRR